MDTIIIIAFVAFIAVVGGTYFAFFDKKPQKGKLH
jgi:flagellar basal body-associated protein FliL